MLGNGLFAISTEWELGVILIITLLTIACAAIPLAAGVRKGHIALGVIGALMTVPASALFFGVGGFPVACVFTLLISLIPSPSKTLLSQSEVEEEIRRIRGF